MGFLVFSLGERKPESGCLAGASKARVPVVRGGGGKVPGLQGVIASETRTWLFAYPMEWIFKS